MNPQLLLELTLIGSVFVVTGIGLHQLRKFSLTRAQKGERVLLGLLGAFLLMAGSVKFFEPFNSMFTAQIALSELPLPLLARWAGQLGEMAAGAMLLLVLLLRGKLADSLQQSVFYAAAALTSVIMLVAVYVHLLPGVPAEVLPLQSKPPVLTLIVMGLLGLTVALFRHNQSIEQATP